MIYIGCCGWGYLERPKESSGVYKSILAYYSSIFNTVEVNSTFYKVPRFSTSTRWKKEAREVNSDFIFTIKVSRIITHLDRFSSDKSLELIRFYIDFAKELESPIILFQLSKGFPSKNMENIKEMFDLCQDPTVRFALEARNLEFAERNEFAKESMSIPVIDPFLLMKENLKPIPMFNTYYFRLHGSPPGRVIYQYDYSDEDLRELLLYIEPLKDYNVYVFFNNTKMYKNAMRFQEMVS
ncbi:MAG: DUF72 domain-containing protein [bacterium]